MSAINYRNFDCSIGPVSTGPMCIEPSQMAAPVIARNDPRPYMQRESDDIDTRNYLLQYVHILYLQILEKVPTLIFLVYHELDHSSAPVCV